jgi:hypothetical protein
LGAHPCPRVAQKDTAEHGGRCQGVSQFSEWLSFFPACNNDHEDRGLSGDRLMSLETHVSPLGCRRTPDDCWIRTGADSRLESGVTRPATQSAGRTTCKSGSENRKTGKPAKDLPVRETGTDVPCILCQGPVRSKRKESQTRHWSRVDVLSLNYSASVCRSLKRRPARVVQHAPPVLSPCLGPLFTL